MADAHPAEEPEMRAKMKRVSAAVRSDTPTTSRPFIFVAFGSTSNFDSCWSGMRRRLTIATGMAMIVVKRNTHGHDANSMKSAPMMRPMTGGFRQWRRSRRVDENALLPTAPLPPNMLIARDCSSGSGKSLTIRLSAEGIVNEATG